MKIVGHRGACGYAPENTLLSFQKAIDLGCDRTEFDVRITQDGYPVVIHDAELSRTTNGTGFVNETALGDIKKLSCAEKQKISTLQEVLDFCSGKIAVQIELKSEGSAQAVCNCLRKCNFIGEILITSFNIDFLKEVKAIKKEIPIGLLFKEPREDLFELSKSIGLTYICPKYNIVTSDMVSEAKKQNLRVYAYHVNSIEDMQKMYDFGVDDVGTDFPELGRNFRNK